VTAPTRREIRLRSQRHGIVHSQPECARGVAPAFAAMRAAIGCNRSIASRSTPGIGAQKFTLRANADATASARSGSVPAVPSVPYQRTDDNTGSFVAALKMSATSSWRPCSRRLTTPSCRSNAQGRHRQMRESVDATKCFVPIKGSELLFGRSTKKTP
jgi:hypothetical protein